MVPLVLILALLVMGWTLLADRMLRQGIEAGGTAAVGAKVDSLVNQQVAAARAKLTALQTDVQGRLGTQQQQLQDVQAELERRAQDLGQVIPGVRLPSLPRIRP